MKRVLKPCRHLGGSITVPGDKSIAHRAVLFSILAREPVKIINFPDSKDCQASLNAVRKFGVEVSEIDDYLVLTPPENLNIASDTVIDCGNSGTTARLLAGIIAGSDLEVTLEGDASLSARPMKRIIDPLTEMGAEFFAEDGHLPMRIRGHHLLPFEYLLPVASAQVKSAILLAGLASSCSVTIKEKTLTRNHTEIMLNEIGEGITVENISPVVVADPVDPRKKKREMPKPYKKEIRLTSQARINGGTIDIPGDISTAAFFMGAAAITKQTITIKNVGLNPTRTAFIAYLKQIGCNVEISNRKAVSGEARGDVTVTGASLKARRVSGETTVELIDEIPIISVMAAFAEGTTIIRNAEELRVKESDRLFAISENLKLMGVNCGLLDDGLAIEGIGELAGADFKAFGDHRIAMAFSIASLALVGPSSIDDDYAVDVSCPDFYRLLDQIKE